jgi:hypothetical protein
LDFLGFAGERPVTNVNFPPGWPSWLPYWGENHFITEPFAKTVQEEGGFLGGNSRVVHSAAYSASGRLQTLNSFFVRDLGPIKVEGSELRVKEFSIGAIFNLGPPFQGESWRDVSVVQHDWAPLFPTIPYYLTGETVGEAYLRLIVADVKIYIHKAIRRGWAMEWPTAGESSSSDVIQVANNIQSVTFACQGRRLAHVYEGAMALVPEEAADGDQVFVLFGGQVLYVLRPIAEHFEFIGECYIHGLMDGEALERLESGASEVRDIRIR